MHRSVLVLVQESLMSHSRRSLWDICCRSSHYSATCIQTGSQRTQSSRPRPDIGQQHTRRIQCSHSSSRICLAHKLRIWLMLQHHCTSRLRNGCMRVSPCPDRSSRTGSQHRHRLRKRSDWCLGDMHRTYCYGAHRRTSPRGTACTSKPKWRTGRTRTLCR